MTPAQIQQRSMEKQKEVQALLEKLHVNLIIKKRVDLKSGIIDDMIIFQDNEEYVVDAPRSETNQVILDAEVSKE